MSHGKREATPSILHSNGIISQDYLSLRGSGFSTAAVGPGWGPSARVGGVAPLGKGAGAATSKNPLRKISRSYVVGSGVITEDGSAGAKAFRPGSASRPGSARRPSTSSGESVKAEDLRLREDGNGFTWDKLGTKDKGAKGSSYGTSGSGVPQSPLSSSSTGRRPSTGGWDMGQRGVRRSRVEDEQSAHAHTTVGRLSGSGADNSNSNNSVSGGADERSCGSGLSNGGPLSKRTSDANSGSESAKGEHSHRHSHHHHHNHSSTPRHHHHDQQQPASSDGDGSSRNSQDSQSSQRSHKNHSRRQHGGPIDVSSQMVTIHVCDEARGITRDFYCERQLLLREMKYFRGYLEDACGSYDEIDIMVHCDVRIFEWLFDYIHVHGKESQYFYVNGGVEVNGLTTAGNDKDKGGKETEKQKEKDKEKGGYGKISPSRAPKLEVSSAVSILISSAFLQMDRLVSECLSFVNAHLSEVVKLPIDLSCINEEMVTRLAKMASLQELAAAKDQKDKLLSRIHKKRIELDFRERNPSNTIFCCRHCHQLFPEKALEEMACPMAPAVINFRGRVIRRHEIMQPWSLTQLVTALHRRGMTWTEVFWFLWGLTQVHHCLECGETFTAGDLAQCRWHSLEPVYNSPHTLQGMYPCCNRPAKRFSPEAPPPGCTSGDHIMDLSTVPLGVVKLLHLQRRSITYVDWRDAVQEEGRALAARAGVQSLNANKDNFSIFPPPPEQMQKPPRAPPVGDTNDAAAGDGSDNIGGGAGDASNAQAQNSGERDRSASASASASVDGRDEKDSDVSVPGPLAKESMSVQLWLLRPHTVVPQKLTALLPDHHPLHVQPRELLEEWRSLDRDKKDISDVHLRKFRMDIQREADEARMAALSSALIAKRESIPGDSGRAGPPGGNSNSNSNNSAGHYSSRSKSATGGNVSSVAAAAGNGANAVYKQASAAASAAAAIASLSMSNGTLNNGSSSGAGAYNRVKGSGSSNRAPP